MSAERPLPPSIAAQLSYLLNNSPLPLKVDQIWSGCRNSRYSDRFTLLIPFCLDYIKWDFMYNEMYPSVPPDIVFSAEDEGFNPLLEIAGGGEKGEERKSCLRSWSSKDPSKLLSLFLEIRELYLEYHRKRVGELDDERLKFETDTILSRKAEEVRFAVPLLDEIDLNKLVPGSPWRRQQKFFLQVGFPVNRGFSASAPTPRIRLVSSPDLKTLMATEDIKLPSWVAGMCMAEYLPTFEDNLKMQVVEAVAAIGARRRFIEALLPLFGRPVEADSVFCRKASVLASSGVFTFLVHFSIPTQFPRLQPTLTLQSCQNWTNQGLAIVSPPINDYPWSPRWEVPKMAERIFEFLVDESLAFKKHCADASSVAPS
ncbi:BRCA1-A complex subunit BRE [Asparagus officinalis]|uniref:BRCA1-A complex subunit BRE n=1 Tax=Asparagus officinalis TaxID=4686 RepID=UPI00098E4F2D|nr:BRCA1-A complex subunit BRE [Asparagus officinalis]